MNVSAHAQRRMQQRSIPPNVIELLERFGSENRCGGASHMYFDKAARRRMHEHYGESGFLKRYETWLNIYIVVGDNGMIITAAHRTSHIRRHPSTRQVTRYGLH